MIHGRWGGAGTLVLAGLIHASCSAGGEARGSRSAGPDSAPTAAAIVQGTGLPAQPDAGAGAVSDRSRVISMEEMRDRFPDRGEQPGCFITFAYRGEAPETLIWDREPCARLTARFADRAFLEASDNWARLDEAQRTDVDAAPDGQVLYVEGQFTASIYPLGSNHLTYEVVVSD